MNRDLIYLKLLRIFDYMGDSLTKRKSSSFIRVPGGNWTNIGSETFSLIISNSRHLALFSKDQGHFEMLLRKGLDSEPGVGQALGKAKGIVDAQLDNDQMVSILNLLLKEASKFSNDEQKIFSQMNKLVEKYCGQSIDAIAILIEGYRLGKEDETFAMLSGYKDIDMVHPRARGLIHDIPGANRAFGFLRKIMVTGVVDSLQRQQAEGQLLLL